MTPKICDLKPQLARDIRAAAKHFRLTAAEEKACVEAARRTVFRAARMYRAIAASLERGR